MRQQVQNVRNLSGGLGAQDAGDALDGLGQFLVARGKGEAQVSFARLTKCNAWRQRYVSFPQQEIGGVR
jgi:hypothetical protein